MAQRTQPQNYAVRKVSNYMNRKKGISGSNIEKSLLTVQVSKQQQSFAADKPLTVEYIFFFEIGWVLEELHVMIQETCLKQKVL